MKTTTILAIPLLLCGCLADAENTVNTSNPNVKSEILFTDDEGYTVHRFRDGGNMHYYVTPTGQTMTLQGAKHKWSDRIETK